MSPAQRRDFELIAVGLRPLGGYKTINALKAAGLIVDGAPRHMGRDCFGEITIPTWYVPLPIHHRWCVWCSKYGDVASK